MGYCTHREPHINLRRIGNDQGIDRWVYVVIDGRRSTSGTFYDNSTISAWRRVSKVLRKPNKQVWIQLTDQQCREYGLIVAQKLPPVPPSR